MGVGGISDLKEMVEQVRVLCICVINKHALLNRLQLPSQFGQSVVR